MPFAQMSSSSTQSITELAAGVISVCRERHLTVATCESLTGGLIAAALTSIPGASDVVRGGLVTYATDLKTSLAGVEADLIDQFSVVSSQVAGAMAAGARHNLGADWAVAVTGVAGPGPSDGVPAGTVWVGIANATEAFTERLDLAGDRSHIRRDTVVAALEKLTDHL
jgi:nicotinamide-nucleotide amidase